MTHIYEQSQRDFLLSASQSFIMAQADGVVLILFLVLMRFFRSVALREGFDELVRGGRAPLNRTGLAQQPPLLIVSGVSWQRVVEKLTTRRKTEALKRLSTCDIQVTYTNPCPQF